MSWIKTLVLSAILVFAPIKASILTVGVLIFVDLILGIWAAIKRGEKITSSGLKRTVIKAMVYETAILAGFLVEQYLTGSVVPITKIISGFIGITELKSLLESLNEIQGGDVLKVLINKINVKDEDEK